MEFLTLLVERRGELVTRGDIAGRLWGADQPGDAERGINTAVRKIRHALGDDADRPRFVETVVGKGYRFVAAVEGQGPAAAGQGSRAPRYWGIAAVAGLIAIAPAAILVRTASTVVPPMTVRPFTALPGLERSPAFSPDGNQVAFSWNDEEHGQQHIYIKSVGAGPEMRLTSAAEHDSNPAWSPDGRWIAFLREDAQHTMAVYAISPSGSGERRIAGLSQGRQSSISWSADGKTLAVVDSDAPGAPPGIFLVSLGSGEKRRLTRSPESGHGDANPAFSPDGRSLAFLRSSGSLQSSSPYLLPVDTRGYPSGDPRKIETDRADLTRLDWSADGRSLICSGLSSLFRIPLSGGPAEPLPFQNAGDPSVARRGRRLVYALAVQETAIFRVPAPGTPGAITKLIASSRFNGAPKYSPDGKRIVFMSDRTGTDELWLADSDGQHATELTSFGRATLGSPRWSPDSRRIAFDATAEGPPNIYVIAADGSQPRRITTGASSNVRPSWSRDGRWIYFGSDRGGAWEIWKCSPEGTAPIQVTHRGGREAFEDPEGSFLYYTRQAPAQGIWRMPVAGGGAEQVSNQGVQAQWEVGRRGLYYLNDRHELELSELSTGTRVAIPAQGLQFSGGFGGLLGIAPDDRWILITAPVRFESDLSLVENFR